ncbi:DUF1992 domain-containing protein [Goekera deserti]|uniref:DUF1992 domain-containing protein n=1 Tax=Goekera deserti TaxID=2497753 RepID=A0A7K3WAR2_9ACTN|nr:DUF1992 domain-containing protein [Goekera deserti]NDI47810.1 DUF1992 domain-containing protein [Goekera deserti]NEL53558.1 DUF1992 domain-containing protein [Goekera deserti]
MTERKPSGTTFETWVDEQIRAARERGAFDDLPGTGRPLPQRTGTETSYDWAVAWARRQEPDLRVMLPMGLRLRKEWEELPLTIVGLRSEQQVRLLLGDYNDRVRAMWRRPQDGPTVVTPLVDVDQLVADWRAARPVPPPPTPAPPARRGWLRRRARQGDAG